MSLIALAIPTIWEEVLERLNTNPISLPELKRIVSGGSAVPSWVIREFKEKYDVNVLHAWGMTEMSPLGTANSPLMKHTHLDNDQSITQMENAGRPTWAVQIKIIDDSGKELPRGNSEGRILVRGPTVIQRYIFEESDTVDETGWFETGDLGVLDSDGYLTITDNLRIHKIWW